MESKRNEQKIYQAAPKSGEFVETKIRKFNVIDNPCLVGKEKVIFHSTVVRFKKWIEEIIGGPIPQ